MGLAPLCSAAPGEPLHQKYREQGEGWKSLRRRAWGWDFSSQCPTAGGKHSVALLPLYHSFRVSTRLVRTPAALLEAEITAKKSETFCEPRSGGVSQGLSCSQGL